MPQDYRNKLKEIMGVKDALIEHHAPLSQELILKILRNLEEKMDSFGEKLKVTRKAFNVVTESLQNVVKYANKEAQQPDTFPVFVLDRQSDKYQIGSGNLISKEKTPQVKAKLEQLNSLDWYGIQQAYKEAIRKNLKNEDTSRDKNSAGLGFIEMARKSEQKLIFDFYSHDSKTDYFILVVIINK
jgi:bacterioferritin (cytochrome b1)